MKENNATNMSLLNNFKNSIRVSLLDRTVGALITLTVVFF